jgi:hypothetical protein
MLPGGRQQLAKTDPSRVQGILHAAQIAVSGCVVLLHEGEWVLSGSPLTKSDRSIFTW